MTENLTSSRLLALLSLLQARRDWPGGLLAERLSVTPRTVRRDVERLRALGYEVRSTRGPDGGYRLVAGSDLPPLLFDDDQAVALAVALGLASTSGAGVGEAATRALSTLRQLMPARLRHRLDAVRFATPPVAAAPEVDPSVLVAVTASVEAHEVLRFDHRREGGEPDAAPGPPRRVEPHALVARGGRWYLLGWDLDRDGWRTFRADRVTPRVPTGPRFVPREVPGGDPAAFVEQVFRGAAGGPDPWPCTGTVELALPAADVAPYTADGVVEALGDDRCRLTLGAWSWTGVAASVLRFDADVVVVGPPELAEAFAVLGSRCLAAGRPGAGAVAPRSRLSESN